MDVGPIRIRGRRSLIENVGFGVFAVGIAVPMVLFVLSLTTSFQGSLPGAIVANGFSWGQMFVPIAMLLALPWIGYGIESLGARRTVRVLLSCNLRMCLNCRYRLAGLTPSGTCPECGAGFSPASLSQGWKRTYPRLGRMGRPLEHVQD